VVRGVSRDPRLFLLLLLKNHNKKPMRLIKANPPNTPPTTGPASNLVLAEIVEAAAEVSDDAAVVLRATDVDVLLRVAGA
jgi:hypothetical protein